MRRARPDARDAGGGTAVGPRPGGTPSPPHVLLVEALDAIGSDALDAREHEAVFRATGARIQTAILTSCRREGGAAIDGEVTPTSAVPEFDDGRAGLAALRAFAVRGRFDLAVVAAASTGGGVAARALAPVVPTRWWPTGLAPALDWRARLGWQGAGAGRALAAEGSEAGAPAGLSWSSVRNGRVAHGRLALWDGEYVLAPLPPAGDDGARLLAAFAEVAPRWTGHDLVVLADPQPAFERRARALGIGVRVHCVGAAPREAEWAWWSHASAALLAGPGPISGGLVLRGLLSGCPLVVASAAAPCAVIGQWLAGHGCSSGTPGGDAAPGAALARTLERGPRVDEATARGRSLAARHEPTRLASRLAAALDGLLVPPAEAPPAAAA
jgi:hypothetical protein